MLARIDSWCQGRSKKGTSKCRLRSGFIRQAIERRLKEKKAAANREAPARFECITCKKKYYIEQIASKYVSLEGEHQYICKACG
jgi:metal-responsive CopG/Arc/MetJ family transcriptional regulator